VRDSTRSLLDALMGHAGGVPTAPGFGLPGLTGVEQARGPWDVVTSAHAPDLPGDTFSFVALEDGTLVVDDDVPDGSATPLDSRLTTNHVATLTGLAQGSNYYYRAVSEGETETFSAACRFTTLRPLSVSEMFPLTQSWAYTTNNLDGVNWKTASYDDSGWMGQGPGLLHVLETSAGVAPKNTVMPPLTTGLGIPRTYYFRTHFNFTGDKSAVSLIFSNYVDDGAVFYLNGIEAGRVRLPSGPLTAASTGGHVVRGGLRSRPRLAAARLRLVDGPGRDLLGGVLVLAPVEHALLDVLVLTLALLAPCSLWHLDLLFGPRRPTRRVPGYPGRRRPVR